MSSTSSNTDARRSSNPGPYLIVIENVRAAISLSVRGLIANSSFRCSILGKT